MTRKTDLVMTLPPGSQGSGALSPTSHPATATLTVSHRGLSARTVIWPKDLTAWLGSDYIAQSVMPPNRRKGEGRHESNNAQA